MESLNMTQKELAIRTGVTVQTLNRIFKGEQPISYETSNKLELATSVPSRMWNNLEAQYREQLAKLKELKQLEADLDWLTDIPVNELVKRKAIEAKKDKVLMLRETLKFFGVSSVSAWHDIWSKPGVAARRSQCFETRPGAAATWIRLGEIQARQIECRDYSKKQFYKALEKIRSITIKGPEDSIQEMKALCAESGVGVSLVPEMQKVPWHGATKWLSATKAMILLNLRGKAEDQFWFSFFHEAGHVLNDSKKDLFINDGKEDDPNEKKANVFAAEFLIPSAYDHVISRLRSKADIILLSNKLQIAPGIVAGRFQRLTKKWAYFKNLIRSFHWANASHS
ncbi:ImmA/IrrE family metallo-endopeptidase [Thermodesulfobacteriota bacterium]